MVIAPCNTCLACRKLCVQPQYQKKKKRKKWNKSSRKRLEKGKSDLKTWPAENFPELTKRHWENPSITRVNKGNTVVRLHTLHTTRERHRSWLLCSRVPTSSHRPPEERWQQPQSQREGTQSRTENLPKLPCKAEGKVETSEFLPYKENQTATL